MRNARTAIGLIATLCLLGALAVPAQGAHHLTKIRQIHPDNTSVNGGDWVELQLPAAGENLVAGTTTIRTFFGDGSPMSQYVIGNGVGPHPGAPNGQNQRTILVSSLFEPFSGVDADFIAPPANLEIVGQDGAVCYTENNSPTFTPIDCVAYGAFTGTALIPSAGAAAVATPFESTLERDITRGCATALDAADDTDNSSADFALSTRAPRNNTMAPTETLCPTQGAPTPVPTPTTPTTPAKKCKKKKKKGKGKAGAAAKKKKRCKKRKKKK